MFTVKKYYQLKIILSNQLKTAADVNKTLPA